MGALECLQNNTNWITVLLNGVKFGLKFIILFLEPYNIQHRQISENLQNKPLYHICILYFSKQE